MRVIGIDIGTSLGWSIVEDGRHIDSGEVNLRPHAWEGFGMREVRARQTIEVLLERAPGAVVAIELVRRHAGTQAGQVYGAILAGVTGRCEELRAPYTFVSVQEAKLAATDHGAAEKASMVAAAKAVFGVDPGEDEADAIWVAVAAGRREGDPTKAPAEDARERGNRKAKERRKARKEAA